MAKPAVITVADTIAKSFLFAVETRGDKPPIREKHLGVWQSTSWREWLKTAREIAYALHAEGFKPGDVASIVSNADPRMGVRRYGRALCRRCLVRHLSDRLPRHRSST